MGANSTLGCMKTSSRAISLALLLTAGFAPAMPAFAASDTTSSPVTVSEHAREQLAQAFAAARDFRPRGERSLYELGREDAEAAMRAADTFAVTKSDHLLATNIRRYFAARISCRDTATINEYGTCEARASEQFGQHIAASLEAAAARTAGRLTEVAVAGRAR